MKNCDCASRELHGWVYALCWVALYLLVKPHSASLKIAACEDQCIPSSSSLSEGYSPLVALLYRCKDTSHTVNWSQHNINVMRHTQLPEAQASVPKSQIYRLCRGFSCAADESQFKVFERTHLLP